MQRKILQQMSKEYEEYYKEEKQLYEKKKQFKGQIRKDLNAQINYRKYIIVSVYTCLSYYEYDVWYLIYITNVYLSCGT